MRYIRQQKFHQLTDRELWKIASCILRKPIHELWGLELNDQETALMDDAVERYLIKEPLTKIAGCTKFYGLDFKVTHDVLDPRPETELLVDLAIKTEAKSVLDLGTGSGCIACSIAKNLPDANVVAVDISDKALEVAKANAEALQVKVDFRLSNWLENVTEKFDLIVSNPPYVSRETLLPDEVAKYDPEIALRSGPDGCDAHRYLLPKLLDHLNPKGTVIWEIGYDQGSWIYNYAVSIFTDASKIEIIKDWNLNDRILLVEIN